MYQLAKLKESVRIPPALFSDNMSQSALKIVRDEYERTVQREHGILVSLHNAKIISKGKVIPGDGAAYFDVEFDALVFNPVVNEVIMGEISEIVEFGAFVRMGPIDGLVHVSQFADDFFTFDKKKNIIVGRKTKAVVKKGDVVKAKVATVSFKDNIPNSKIALTMRPAGLGKVK